jgi:hypothetical protein
MVIILAIGFYKLIKRFPLIVLLLYSFETGARIVTVESEKEMTEEVEILSRLKSLIEQNKSENLIKVSSLISEITELVIGDLDYNLFFLCTTHYKLYIIYCKLTLDHRRNIFRNEIY